MATNFFQSEDGAKRLKLGDNSAASAATVTVTKPGGIRRSTRHRKLRGEKALIVSANQTLKELKIQVRAKCLDTSLKHNILRMDRMINWLLQNQ